MTALLVRDTMPGMRALDIIRGLDVLARRPEVDASRAAVIRSPRAAVPSLYSELLDNRVSTIALEGMLNCYETVLNERLGIGLVEQVVPSALKCFDFPDIVEAIAPRRVILEGNVNAVGQPMRLARVREDYGARSVRLRSPRLS